MSQSERARLKGVITGFTTRLGEIAEELRELLATTNPLDFCGILYAQNCIGVADTYKESEETGSSAYVEYAQQLALTQPETAYAMDRADPYTAAEVASADLLIREAFDVWMYRLMAQQRAKAEAGENDELVDLRFRCLARALRVRNSCYDMHGRLTHLALDAEVGTDLRAVVGFTVGDASKMVDALVALYQRRLDERFELAREQRAEIGEALAAKVSDSELSKEDIARTAAAMSSTWVFYSMSQMFSVSVEEVSAEADVPKDVAEEFLEAMSLAFGSVSPKHFAHPNPTPPISERPLLRVEREGGERAYFCPVPMTLRGAVRPRMEELLNPDSAAPSPRTTLNAWNSYEHGRSQMSEGETMRLFASIFGDESCHRSLAYEPDGADGETELDGLVVHDRLLVFVEVKAGHLNGPARRAAPKAMMEALDALVGEAHAQAERALEYVRSRETAVFRLPSGDDLEVSRADYDDVLLVTVSLEPLDAFVTNLQSLKALGVVSGGRLPWSVYLEDLRVVADIVEGPTQFVHYLRRRARINDFGQLVAHDELDWFGNYLAQGLYFEDELAGEGAPDLMMVQSFTEPFDDFYLYEQGQRATVAHKPKQETPEELRSLIRVLERRKPPGYLHAGACLLEMGGPTRDKLVKWMRDLKKSGRKGRTRDFSFVYGDMGFTFNVVQRGDVPEALRNLRGYIEWKARQVGASHWVGVLTHPGNKTSLRELVVWRADSTCALAPD